MNPIKRKLNSDSGASMILALALLLICVMVSSVIVAAAASGSSRNAARVKKQQDYLAVTSGAQIIANSLDFAEGSQFSGVLKTDKKPCNVYKNYALTSGIELNGELVDAYLIPSPQDLLPGMEEGIEMGRFYLTKDIVFCTETQTVEVYDAATSFDGPFADLMVAAASKVFLKNTPYTCEFTMAVDDERLPNVVCDFTMKTDYTVVIVVRSESIDSNYSITVTMNTENVIYNEEGIREEVTCSLPHKYFYEYSDSVGNVHTSDVGEYTFSHEVFNPTTTIIWGEPVISKGGN